ncbi:MAG: hypothetical protein ABIN48_06040 [Ginsengibacter sp.]
MKKSILTLATILLVATSFGQSEKYMNSMKQNIAQINLLMQNRNFTELANNFARIGDAEKDKWLPYYYAAYCTISQAYGNQDNSNNDAIANKATEYISKAESILGTGNSEINVIKSMIATAQMLADPQSRFMTYGTQSTEFLKKAKVLDPTNPRPILLEAQNIFYTPETFGGGKDAAHPLFIEAQKLFDNFKMETDLSPDWGKQNVEYFLSQYKN